MTQTTWVKHDLKHNPEKEAEYHLLWSGTSTGHHVTENSLSWHLSGAWKAAPSKPEPEEAPASVSRAVAWNQHSHGAVGAGADVWAACCHILSQVCLSQSCQLTCIHLVLCLLYRTAGYTFLAKLPSRPVEFKFLPEQV